MAWSRSSKGDVFLFGGLKILVSNRCCIMHLVGLFGWYGSLKVILLVEVVGIVGGSDSAAKEAMVLSQNSKKVYMFIRSHLKAEPINAERIKKIKNVEIIEGVNIKEIKGSQFVESVDLDNGNNISLEGLFIAVGMLPQNELAEKLNVKLNKRGEVIIDKNSVTNIKGVFAAGDNTDADWKQGIVAASEGAHAAHSAFEYINNNF